jgi:hypothetical protein
MKCKVLKDGFCFRLQVNKVGKFTETWITSEASSTRGPKDIVGFLYSPPPLFHLKTKAAHAFRINVFRNFII